MSEKISFEKWMELVNGWLDNGVGMISDDLPDFDYYAAYEDGVSPSRVAMRAIQNAGSF